MGDMWIRPLEQWEQWMIAADRPETTRKLRGYQLRRFARDHADPWSVQLDDIVSWLAGHEWATETRRGYRAALRTFYGWAHVTGRLTANPAGLLPPIRPHQGEPKPTPLTVVRKALVDADERVRLMVLLAAQSGLRRGEIARVHSRDLFRDLTGWSLRVHGKGGKTRIVPIEDDVAMAIAGHGDAWVFPGKIDGHLSPARVGELVSEVLGAGWATHSLRHRFATAAYAGGRDLFAVQTLLGHQSPATTRRYVLLPDEALREAARSARIA